MKNHVSETSISANEKGAPDGVATLTGSGKLTDNQLPNYIDTMLEFQIPTLVPPDLDIKLASTKEAEYIVYIESKMYSVHIIMENIMRTGDLMIM